ncbi:MAG: hypothetical protein SGPRY_008355 [Prymnesium sp.]
MRDLPKRTAIEKAWARYVLCRPGMTFKELRSVTQRPSNEQFSLSLDPTKRTPGTLRTLLVSSLFVFAAAVPALIQNPAVLVKLIELASLDRIGITPMEMLRSTGSLW